ncbi:hypothetical protein GH5_01205 [Leishmania sp. Ghana 2012 LV757]|uniref:hypothetical protein n=1 Tax=Leishmania sp. Ghana 2012 LV757 TaxID=2803181 RepID=UPI001B79BED8|nr:hypothetical protein GH5_01205 [Leishmania sp. Ghana 2012 LV757]
MLKDYYAILDVLPRASGEEIRRAFKRLALQFHPDKTGGAAAIEAAATVHTDECSLTTSRAENPSGTAGIARLDALKTTCRPCTRDFTDIQEAYEVLGDVARRYLYDMNYQELLALQQQRQEEEQQRCDAQARGVAEPARRVRECECLRREQQQQNHQSNNTTTLPTVNSSTTSAALRSALLGPSLPQHTPLPTRGRGEEDTGVSSLPLPPNDALQNQQRRRKQASAEEMGGDCLIEDLEGDESGAGRLLDDRYGFTVPTRPLKDGSRADAVQTRRQGGDHDTGVSVATGQTQRRISYTSTKRARHRMATTVPAVFLLSGSVAFSWGDTAAKTCPSVAERGRSRERRWHRHATLRDGDATAEPDLPLEHYYQRSIERTLRVFFGVPHLE